MIHIGIWHKPSRGFEGMIKPPQSFTSVLLQQCSNSYLGAPCCISSTAGAVSANNRTVCRTCVVLAVWRAAVQTCRFRDAAAASPAAAVQQRLLRRPLWWLQWRLLLPPRPPLLLPLPLFPSPQGPTWRDGLLTPGGLRYTSIPVTREVRPLQQRERSYPVLHHSTITHAVARSCVQALLLSVSPLLLWAASYAAIASTHGKIAFYSSRCTGMTCEPTRVPASHTCIVSTISCAMRISSDRQCRFPGPNLFLRFTWK